MAYDSTNESDLLLQCSRDDDLDAKRMNRMCPKLICLLVSFLVGLVLLIMLLSGVTTVDPGEAAVVVTFGHASALKGQGIWWTTPLFSRVYKLTTKTQKFERSNTVPTKEGLSVNLDIAIIYRIDPDKALEIFTTIGKNYADILIAPVVSSALRIMTADSEAKTLYTEKRASIQEALRSKLEAKLAPRGIVVEDVLLKDVRLPSQLKSSIEEKARAEQDAKKMQFVLAKERQEAERKAIEARGIADFQSIVSEGISPKLLQWKGIEATETLAESKNTKIVIMGNTPNGLPVLLSDGQVGV